MLRYPIAAVLDGEHTRTESAALTVPLLSPFTIQNSRKCYPLPFPRTRLMETKTGSGSCIRGSIIDNQRFRRLRDFFDPDFRDRDTNIGNHTFSSLPATITANNFLRISRLCKQQLPLMKPASWKIRRHPLSVQAHLISACRYLIQHQHRLYFLHFVHKKRIHARFLSGNRQIWILFVI